MDSLVVRVLVVDDSATSRLALVRQLTALACDVLAASQGQEALALLRTQSVDMVLLDCCMPVMDGFECVAALRKEEQRLGRPHLPVIGISGEADPAHLQRCLDSGMDGMLTKPISAVALENMLSLWCDRVTGEVPTDVPDHVHHLATVDLTALFRQTSEEDYVRLAAMIQAGDALLAGQLVHRMKGAALTMHAPAMAQVLKEIEAALQGRQSATDLDALLLALQQHIDHL